MSCPALRRASLVGALLLVTTTAYAQPRCARPRVLFVVDKSSSMREPAGGGGSKWEAATGALEAVTGELAGVLEIGLQLFPWPDRCEPGAIVLDVGDHTAAQVVAALGGAPPEHGSFTPMAETLDAIDGYAPMLDPEIDAHVVLVTDGWQWCDPHDPARRFAPVASVERLRDLGLTVHVVGFGSGVDAVTLGRAAIAGGTAPAGCDPSAEACHLRAHDAVGLREALAGIARALTVETCDGWDNDCDGATDEGFDDDRDGYTTCGSVPGEPGVLSATRRDCDDTAPAVFPGAGEACNEVDDDCDGVVDAGCACADGIRRACGTERGACALGAQVCRRGEWGACVGGVLPAEADLCDGADEDCDGLVDEGADCGMGSLCVAGRCEPIAPPEAEPAPIGPEAPEEVDPPSHPPLSASCACRSAGSSGRAPLAALVLLGLLLWRRQS